MPPHRQPKLLYKSCAAAVSKMIIEKLMSCPGPEEEQNLKHLVNQHVPPVVFHDVLFYAAKLMGSPSFSQSSPSVLSSLLGIVLHPKLTEVNLSELTYFGRACDEYLDIFESAVVKQLPLMPQLTHLDLSTHSSDTTLPICSDKVLKVLATWCPNISVLNLNFNEDVTAEGLSHLCPSDDNVGCRMLERLFIQGCNINAEDVALVVFLLPNLEIVGFRELGVSLRILKTRSVFRKKFGHLKLTHIDNTSSRARRDDGDIVDFVVESCPCIENLRIRVCDENLNSVHQVQNLKHLEIRFYTTYHRPMGPSTKSYFLNYGNNLASLTTYCACLYSSHLLAITENCVNLKKLFLHANRAEIDELLIERNSRITNLEVLQLRLGDNELIMHDIVPLSFLVFISSRTKLKELNLMIRSSEFGHHFLAGFNMMRNLSELKTLIVDVPRRTMTAPMLDLNIDTALTIMYNLDKLEILGNLICWNVTPEEVEQLRNEIRQNNFKLKIVYSKSNKLNTKYF